MEAPQIETLDDRMKLKVDGHQPPAKILEQLMTKFNVTPTQLAKAVKCSRNHIHEILRAKCLPSYPLWTRILNYFGYRPSIAKMATSPRGKKKKNDNGAEEILSPDMESPEDSEEELIEYPAPSENGSVKDKRGKVGSKKSEQGSEH